MTDEVIFEQDVAIPLRDGAFVSSTAYAQIAEHGRYLNWETPNPDWWVPRGYVVVRIDQRGIGSSPGTLDLLSRQQGEDFYDAIEWAGIQSWSLGKVGLLGISYYAANQWQVA